MRPGARVGVDVGGARVGVATCDPGGVLATPWQTVPRDSDGGSDQAAIADLVQDIGAIEVVVGLPRSLDGAENAAAATVRAWVAGLTSLLPDTPVRLVDERLTTVDAHRELRDSGLDGRRHRRVVDQAAAVLILQTALDVERSTGNPPGERAGERRRKPRRKGRT